MAKVSAIQAAGFQSSVTSNAFLWSIVHGRFSFHAFGQPDFHEKAGTGIKRIRDEVREQGCPEPEFEANGFFTAIFRPNPEVQAAAGSRLGPSRDQVGTKSALSRHQAEILIACRESQPIAALMMIAGRSDRTKFRDQVLNPLLTMGLLEMTVPDKPRSSKQRYQITRLGIEALKQQSMKGGGGK